jgi:hypothetical protein
MKRNTIMVTAAATAIFLLAAISFNSMMAYAQDGANMTGMAAQKSTTIHLVPEHESEEQIRDMIRSHHPLLAAIADQIETMDARETLKYTLGVEIVADLLKMHAGELIINQTASSQSNMP